MSNMHQDSNQGANLSHEEKEARPKHSYPQPSTSIDIPSSSNDLFYNQMSPQYQEFYNDILSFTSDSSLLDALNHSSIHSDTSSARDNAVDPMNDPQFMAFLASLSTSEPISSPRPSLGSSMLLVPKLDVAQATVVAERAEQEEAQDTKSKRTNSKSLKTIKKRTSKSNTRLGQCEHPKHCLYRQEKYILSTNGTVPADETSTKTSIQSIPRRGRPPKGSKSSEFIYSTSPLAGFADDEAAVEPYNANATLSFYPVVELTVRPLPKRLETVVGKANIKVCLTCLKRSDMDPAYLQNSAYVGPQTLLKRKKE
ncbi:hypothetical protein BD408DRAFT_441033 [Parasitella parasitica]|nr:hypothetical protein BD408DRAFT_441033 [Parasitella parasitica]